MAIGMAPMGITKAKTAYELAHDVASKNAEKMLGLPKNNTAMQRAKALGYDLPAYHGTRSDVKALDPSKAQFAREGSGTWLSENPLLANTYAGKMGGNVMPLLVNTKKYGEIDALKQNWNKIPADTPIRHSNQTDSAMNEYIDRFDDIGDTNLAANISRLNADDGLRVFNVRDVGGYMSGVDNIPELADNLAVFNPATVRSRFAAFDPARVNESDLLAGLAPYLGIGGLLSLGLLTPEEAQAGEQF
jgi:hypothetical protein